MKSAVRNLIFLSIFLFSVSYDSLITGVNYDKKHKLNPEIRDYGIYSCWTSTPIYEYGNRWNRLGTVSFAMGIIVLLTTFLAAVKEEKRLKLPSILIKEY